MTNKMIEDATKRISETLTLNPHDLRRWVECVIEMRHHIREWEKSYFGEDNFTDHQLATAKCVHRIRDELKALEEDLS